MVFVLKRSCIGIIVAIALYFKKKKKRHLDLRTAGCLFKGCIWPNDLSYFTNLDFQGISGAREVIVITYGARHDFTRLFLGFF